MSIHHVECAALTSLPASTKLVLMAFADSADKDTRVAFPGLGNVMAWSGLRKSRALEITRWLVAQGYLVRAAGSTATGPRRRAEYLVFPAGCCPQHGRLDGYAGPDPLNTSAQPDPIQSEAANTSTTPDVDNLDTSGTPDVNNSNGSATPDVNTSSLPDVLPPNTSDLATNTSDPGAEHVRSGPDPSPPPPSGPPPPPARDGAGPPWSHSTDGGGGGDYTAEVQAVFDGLGADWTLSGSQCKRLAPMVAAALQRGWGPDGLADHLGSNAAGVRNPYAVLRARLDDLPDPPGHAVGCRRPPWCGACGEATRMVEDSDRRPSRCPRCHPLQATQPPPAAS